MEITTNVPLHPFLFVGCWNNPNTRDYEYVFERIRADPITTLILGGDNIYPFKDEHGNKRYNVGEVERGFDIAKNGKSLVYTTLGNHNISNPEVFEKIKDLYSITNTYYCVHFADGHSLIFLDSSLFKKAGEPLNQMFEWLKGLIGRIGPYYIVQHYPIASIRYDDVSILAHKNTLLKIIQNNLPIAILCSHAHLFQHGLIEFNSSPHTNGERASPNLGPQRKEIHQYIVGTGGALLDNPPSLDDTSVSEGKFFSYSIINTQKTHGYSRITAPGLFQFVPVSKVKGGYRKTKSKRHRSKRSKTRGKRS